MVKERLSDLKMETLMCGMKMEEGSAMKLTHELEPLDHEADILVLGKQFRDQGNRDEMTALIVQVRSVLNKLSKAKAAKLVRGLIDMFLEMREENEDGCREIKLCKECIEWAKSEKRQFLRQSLEARLVGLFYETKRYQDALELGSALLKELKKLDDKNLLVEVQLLESKTYYSLGNLPKSRAALTSARTTANSIYISPKVQAQLDMQSGILHASEDKDFKTSFSYFFESFEQYDSVEDPLAIVALKYMLMTKIMLNSPDEIHSILSSKLALKYVGSDLDAMRAIALASKKRSLAEFQTALKMYPKELEGDPTISKHINTLYQKMLEQNLSKIVEPYSRVQVSYVASQIKLPQQEVEKKLSKMILDKKIEAILDQDLGALVLFNAAGRDRAADDIQETISHMSKVVDRLYHAANKLN